ncbi:3-dehydroquinate synthase [Fictibacillus gelatini]|uniref:3-dehydroquinate synthase n=1 Tax=Fictibacillus gelatini TaxID=225985 RepID=UPI000427E602|nr:3-dehydroquinate synthase [Fictibacillus gelatini]
METMAIKTKSKEYPLYLGNDAIKGLGSLLADLTPDVSNILIISEQPVADLYLDTVKQAAGHHHKVFTKVIPSGESSKSFENYYDCQTYALESGLDRHSLILALGGGMIGDLAGFVAATFMRGIRFIQIPTTLLAHDSAVGGKVAVNHPLGKNMIGAFHQPEAVIYHLPFLESLPEEEWRSGFAEMIKHSFIGDPELYEWLKSEIKSVKDLRGEKLVYALKRAIAVKANVVLQDEKEHGIRAHLNFGHTLGHAIETELGYGNVSHGDAVAIGMLFATRLSEIVYEKDLQYEEMKKWFNSYGFPHLPPNLNAKNLLQNMKKDKKAGYGNIRMVLMKEVGHLEVVKVSDDLILPLLNEFIAEV